MRVTAGFSEMLGRARRRRYEPFVFRYGSDRILYSLSSSLLNVVGSASLITQGEPTADTDAVNRGVGATEPGRYLAKGRRWLLSRITGHLPPSGYGT